MSIGHLCVHLPDGVMFEFRGWLRMADGLFAAGYRFDIDVWDYWPADECAEATG